ncbi:MAG: transaldolase [Actinobacteria bacterium]|nr:transaldolase [Actinomycetota bacterium]NIS28457.1 transaldolase [Actinomycetota bacterium]NIT93957.1 transaldolase [Actinomycetota bacterium]NIU17593.1 transaldolase [Actinomycetota bacterium]NIU63935.1 transaldolase [Actinomycetota bacterium]
MARLHELFNEQGQSPWLDNIRRGWITSGELEAWVRRGVRGLTSNPSIFQKAIDGSEEYDEEFSTAIAEGLDIEASYWRLVISDIRAALAILRPVYDRSDGLDGYVSVEVDPGLARDGAGTEAAARALHEQLAAPNLYVKIPGTAEGLDPVRRMIAEGRSINVTLIFSLARYAEVMEAYLAGLEEADGDLSRVSSVASFFISRLDTEVDRRLEEVGTPEALALRGKAAVANGKLAYQLFRETFAGPRWDALAARGARVQRPLWASTSTKNPAYPDTLYVDELIGPDTVNTLPDATIDAFEEHGTITRTIDADLDDARAVIEGLAAVGVDLDDVTRQLEEEGVAAFEKSFDELLGTLGSKAELLG